MRILAMDISPIHQWTISAGDWSFGAAEWKYPSHIDGKIIHKTKVYVGPLSLVVREVSAIQVASVAAIVAVVLIALTGFLVTHRRTRRGS